MFPRVSALGERLWSGPSANWKDNFMDVEIRMVTHRQLLVDRGIKADALQPEYIQNLQTAIRTIPSKCIQKQTSTANCGHAI